MNAGNFRLGWTALGLACGLCLGLPGCGQSTNSGGTAANSDVEPAPAPRLGEAESSSMPVASLGAGAAKPEPVKGSPEWLLTEIMRIKLMPYPALDDASPDAEDSEGETEMSATDDGAAQAAEKPEVVEAPVEKTPEERQAALEERRRLRKERNDEVVRLATECMVKTNKNAEQEQFFNAAVHHLLDARMQLALQGDREQMEGIYDAAETLQKRAPQSPSAAAAQAAVVSLNHAMALRYGKQDSRHLEEFAKQARFFASEFPNEQRQSLPLVFAAGRSCEINGLRDEAINCYGLIQAKYPESPQAEQTAGALRRLNLKGQKLEFGGPTLDGNFVKIEDYRNKGVIVVFWAASVPKFQEQLPTLKAVSEKYKKWASFVGVNLDLDESGVDAFLEQAEISWPQIFHPEPTKRGWAAPLATYYGITNIPTVWMIDPNGEVVDTDVDVTKLESQLREMLLPFIRSAAKSKD